MPLLAGRPARPLDTSNLPSQVPDALHRLALFSGAGESAKFALAMGGTFSLSLLEKLCFVDTTSLGQMEFLEAENQSLAKTVALTSQNISTDQSKVLRQALARIASESVVLHKELFEPQSLEHMLTIFHTVEQQGFCDLGQPLDFRLEKNVQNDHYFKVFAEQALPGFISTLTAIPRDAEESIRNAGLATVKLSTILLRLFVPDKPFDPSLGLVVQCNRYAQRVSELTTKSNAVSAFEFGFTGQRTNMRYKILQEELRDLGSAPPSSSVTRPQDSTISLLQGEFSNLIKSVLDRQPEELAANSTDPRTQEMMKLLHENVQQLCRRLSTHYRSYDDITIPVVRFLQILDLGLFSASNQQSNDRVLRSVSEITPFLGGSARPLPTLDSSRPTPNSNRVIDIRFHELSSLGVAANADSMSLDSQTGRNALRRILDQFHFLWKTRLRQDQEEEAQRTNLYQYRGSWEDEEQVDENELNQLFPTYDGNSEDGISVEEGKEPNRFNPKAISQRLASLHAKLFESEDPELALSGFVKESARLLGTLWSENKTPISPMHPKEHLPGILLLLEDTTVDETQISAKKYNFYTDSNFAEAKRLVSLTLSVQSRFVQLQTAWPEHAVLQDVILCCKEIYQFKHSEPVAKFLTKVEKLHALVHEWQLVASREYTAASLYDELTNLIISWRRLELSTWAKLLDLEKEKADQDVSSWWFVAYEAIIGAPVQMAESGETDMSTHTQEVIATLEQFFLSTSLGQYCERLRLVSNFRSLVLFYAQEYPSLKQLASALQNFIDHYKPFEPLVGKLLAEKRSGLEKDIKEQIQLASWKDTNIVALRESARRSHHKLFKLVRKYREALSLPVQPTLEQGMSDYSEEPGFAPEKTDSLSTAVIPEALGMCQKDNHALWINRAPRFKNTDSTVSNMTHLYSTMPTEFDIVEDVDSFVSSVIEGITDFKSQTPKTLTEENKDEVQHLKVLKKRFFADTLRKLLEMGIKRNTSTSLLETQVSSAQVLSTTATFEAFPTSSHLIKNADSYFHRFLDLLPRARQASRHYSEELSNVEASRGIGSVEHLLFTVRKQRGTISPVLSDLGSFKSTLDKMSNLWKSDFASLAKSPGFSSEGQDLSKVVAWLTPILGLASKIVGIHSKFSGIDAANVSKGLQEWKTTFDRLGSSLINLPVLPFGVSSQHHRQVIGETRTSLTQLSANLAKWTADRPDLSFALDQITPWINTKTDSVVQQNGEEALAIQEFDANLLTVVDKILIGLQKLKELPSSISSDGSLTRSDEFFSRAIKAVRSSEITASLESVLDKLRFLQSRPGAGIPYASALIATMLPITNKYYLICEDLVGRFVSVHRETCKMSYVLAKSFTQIASEGFCQPAEASTGEESKSGNLESGTGLGDGEGAEDISKDVGDDEDLSELAQQQNEEAKEDMEDSGDAVNMDQEEMQGDSGERKEDDEEKEDESGEEGEDDIDEEVGSVDDLDTSAVDEKMWDGENDDQQKETENQEGKGVSESDEQTAAEEKDKGQEKEKDEKDGEGKEENEEEEEEEEEAPEDEGEAVGREDMDVTDPHAKEEEALDLPDEMQLDGDDKGDEGDEGEDDDGMDELSDMGAPPVEEQADEQEGDKTEDAADMDQPADEQEGKEDDENPEDANANEAAEGEEEENAAGEEEQPEDNEFLPQRDENEAAGENVAPSEAVNGGLGAEQDQNQEKGSSGDAQQEDGTTDPTNNEQQSGAANEGEDSKRSRDAGGADDMNTEKPEMQAFKKMGDILEQWHRRQQEIMEASKQEDEAEDQPLPQDTDMADADFEHLADQDDVADTQALGQASEEQAKALDQNKGVESEVKPSDNEPLPDVSNEQQEDLPENKLEDEMQLDNDAAPTTEGQTAGAMIPGNSQTQERTSEAYGQQELNEELDEVDSHLAAIHLSSTLPPLTPRDEAQRLWSHYESATTDLSLSLTEQLRLILAPTLATKLRGDFRTGKRLNIKRIIPYIASQYKRDKIWMRRSIPSKRNYQIMLAVDDSKSMLESGSGQLAFETLALVAKSLSMLEAGDLCVLGFGNEDHVRVAHDFGTPFSSEAGTQVFQHFSYQQTGTNVRKLIADSIALFREARWKRSPGAGGGGDLWQLELVISDGICEDHDTIRRLVRQAMEERIMVVFIIVDAVKGSSILDLSQASFEPDLESGTGEMKLKMKRYLEGFPFPYYLVVRDVRELPAVLATALKQWFAEVVDVSS